MNRGSTAVVFALDPQRNPVLTFWQVQANVLSMLTRLRQLALHPGLIPSNYLEDLRSASAEDCGQVKPATINPEDKQRLQRLLSQAIEDYEECPICFSILNDPRITSCAHTFCLPWYVKRPKLP